MRLEYTEEQERELRITEIEAILENHLRDNKIEELALEAELQFLQGNVDGYGTLIAFVGNDDEMFEVTYEDNSYYSMLVHDKEGNPILPYYNADTLEELFGSYMNERKVDVMYKVQYMNYKTKEIAEEEFKHPKHALARYLTIGESMKENGIDICSLKIFNQKGKDITGKVNHFIVEM